jgi:hypothetical protein
LPWSAPEIGRRSIRLILVVGSFLGRPDLASAEAEKPKLRILLYLAISITRI